MEEIWPVMITSITACLIALIELRGHRERKAAAQDRKRAEESAARRVEESLLSMELLSASCRLGVVTAKAVIHQQVTEDLEEAMSAAETAQQEYDKFLRKMASQHASTI